MKPQEQNLIKKNFVIVELSTDEMFSVRGGTGDDNDGNPPPPPIPPDPPTGG